MTPQQTLEKYFGYLEFRPGQLEIIENILEKKDCLAILPTGGGKSICFQIPGLIFPGITIVISPLISLMKDQVDTLNSKGIQSCYISSLLSKKELAATYKLLQLQEFKFVYIAPERLQSRQFQNIISELPVSLLVVDEAHCISQWGDTFRPSYTQISEQKNKFITKCPIVAFTATANQKVQKDICQNLELKNPFIYYKSFKRTNLSIEVVQCFNRTIKNLVLLRLLNKHKNQVGIIYCSTRKTTEELNNYLLQFGVKTEYYHGGLENKEKQSVQLAFSTGRTKIIVATNAFGMGIDVSNIRFVIHYQIPGNIENYYQEMGRAGRDQKPSWCYTLLYQDDVKIQYHLLEKFPKKIRELQKITQLLKKKSCRTQGVLNYFGEKSSKCNNCDVCNNIQYNSQLLTHATSNEIVKITEMVNLRKNQSNTNKNFPITDTLIAFLVILQPKREAEYMKIPGVGTGFLNVWFNHIQDILSQE